MKNIWTYISTLLAGIIAGLLIFLKLDTPETVINDNTRIGKMKQRGQGNDANVTIDPQITEPDPETRADKREARKVGRIARRRERQAKKESG